MEVFLCTVSLVDKFAILRRIAMEVFLCTVSLVDKFEICMVTLLRRVCH